MSKTKIGNEKESFLNELIKIYRQEVLALYAIGVAWTQLKDEAKDKCEDDFDKALIARETFLEELEELKISGIKLGQYETSLVPFNQILLENCDIVKDIYGLDVKAFLNVNSKALLKSK